MSDRPRNAVQLAAWRALWNLLLRPVEGQVEDENGAVCRTAPKEESRDDASVMQHPQS